MVAFSCIGRFFLIFWPLESALTVVPEAKIESPTPTCRLEIHALSRRGKGATLAKWQSLVCYSNTSVTTWDFILLLYVHVGTEGEMQAIEARFEVGDWTPFTTSEVVKGNFIHAVCDSNCK